MFRSFILFASRCQIPVLLGSLFVIFAMLGTVSLAGTKTDGYSAEASYISNYDGDTIRVDIPGLHPLIGENIPIRVRGIDTPEIRGKCLKEKSMAKRAKERVRELLVKHKNIVLEGMERGKYFRIVATVIADGIDIGGLLVSEGLAIPYNGGRKTANWCHGE